LLPNSFQQSERLIADFIEATLKNNAKGEALNPPWMASVVLALEDGFRLHRLIDPETTPADSFLRATADLRRQTGLASE
jgi:hypothetical protein